MLRHLTAALLLAALASPALAAESRAGLVACRLAGFEHDAWCGHVERPLDPDHPDGRRIDVQFALLPAVARNRKADPVFFFAGGPGQSAIEIAGTVSRLLARFANRRDIVLIDQRGTGRSAPLVCDDERVGRPLREAADPERQFAELRACRDRLQALPYGDLRQFTTVIAMQDADAVRALLGAERIDIVGGSYGTRDALEYLRQFPQHVRRIVIDGVVPPDMSLPAAFSADGQRALDALLAACEGEAACAAHHPQLRRRWHELLASLPRAARVHHPLTGVDEPVLVTREMLLGLVRLPLYSPALASALPIAIDDAADGRFDALAALAFGGGGRGNTVAQGMHYSVVCAEDMAGPASAEAPGADFGDSFLRQYQRVCADWPRGAVPAAFYRVAPSAAPVLVMSGALDPVTPPHHGERVAWALGANARHVVVPNAGHGVMGIGCMRDVLFRFIDAETDAEALAVDTTCAQGIPRPPAFVSIEAAR